MNDSIVRKGIHCIDGILALGRRYHFPRTKGVGSYSRHSFSCGYCDD